MSAVAAESNAALECINRTGDNDEAFRAAAYSTYSYYISIIPDNLIDLNEISAIIKEIGVVIHSEQNRVRYTMNGFVISVGTYIPLLLDEALVVAETIGKASVDMGSRNCKVPLAAEYIQKVQRLGKSAKKRKRVITK